MQLKNNHTCAVKIALGFALCNYCIVQIFGEGKPWQITGDSPNFTIQILTMSHDINKKQTNWNSPKFYLPKVSNEFTKVFLREKFMLHGT